ncbi:MAG: hypothetical protein V4527_12005 [Pseudomonadota bacterium]
MTDRRRRPGFAFPLFGGVLGFLTGLIFLVFSQNPALSHGGLILMVASPVIAFWRLMKPHLAPHCPRPPEPGSPQ